MAPTAFPNNLPPGTYVSREPVNAPAQPADTIRMPAFVGRGHRYRTLLNTAIVRGRLFDQPLLFEGPPYRATLPFRADLTRVLESELYTTSDVPVSQQAYVIKDEFLTGVWVRSYVEIDPSAYIPGESYVIDYQSSDPSVLDQIPWHFEDGWEMRNIRGVGRRPNQTTFKERTAVTPGNYVVTMTQLPVVDATTDPAVLALYNTAAFKTLPIPPLADLNDINQWTVNGTPEPGTYAFTVVDDGHARIAGTADLSVPATLAALAGQQVNITFDAPAGPSVAVSHTFAGAPASANDVATILNGVAGGVNPAYGAVFSIDPSNQLVAESPLAGALHSAVDVGAGTANTLLGLTVAVTNGTNAWSVSSIFTPLGGSAEPAQTVTAIFDPSTPVAVNVLVDEQLSFQVPAALDTYNNHMNGTTWSFSIASVAMMSYHVDFGYTAKDSRTYTFTVSGVVKTGPVTDAATLTYSTNTQEGGFGSIDLATTNPLGSNFLRFDLDDGVKLQIDTPDQLLDGQVFQVSIVNEHTLDWSVTEAASAVFNPARNEVLLDPQGLVTGTALNYYVRLSEIPVIDATNPLTITNAQAVVLATVTDLTLPGSPILEDSVILTVPNYNPVADGEITVTYTSPGIEPEMGTTYYLSADILRPLEDYNRVIILRSVEEARAWLRPSSATNQLDIMANIAFEQGPIQGIAVVQVYDADQDDIYTDNDYKVGQRAIRDFADERITDTTTLGRFTTIQSQRANAIAENDPIAGRWRMAYVGFPIGTEIGSPGIAGTIAETAQVTLQVSPDNTDAEGIFAVVANTWARRDVVIGNRSVSTVLDGTYLAGALSALVASFESPAEAILGKSVNGFTDIQTFDESEKRRLVSASAVWIEPQGAGFIWGDSTTTDRSNVTTHEINGSVTSQFVNYGVVDALAAQSIGLAGDAQERETRIRGIIASYLTSLNSRGIIPKWPDGSGGTRDLNAETDISVQVNPANPVETQISFWYDTFFANKRNFVRYSLGANAFGS